MMNTATFHLESDALYLTCFGVGLVLSLITVAGSFPQLPVGRLRLGAGDSGDGSRGKWDALRRPAPRTAFAVVSFFCWFGGAGYLLSHGRVFPGALVMGFAACSGVAGSSLVSWLAGKVLQPRPRPAQPTGMAMIGVLGQVTTAIPSGGLGEMLYTQNGSRRSVPIAAEDGVPIAREAEVVVLHYARGVAYVRRWDEMQAVLLGDEPAAHSNDA